MWTIPSKYTTAADIPLAELPPHPRFVDFGSLPCFIGIWEFASTQERRDTLKTAFAQFVKLYTQDLSLSGPYLHARSNNSLLDTNRAQISVGSTGKAGFMTIHSPPGKSPYTSGLCCVLTLNTLRSSSRRILPHQPSNRHLVFLRKLHYRQRVGTWRTRTRELGGRLCHAFLSHSRPGTIFHSSLESCTSQPGLHRPRACCDDGEDSQRHPLATSRSACRSFPRSS